MNFKFKIDEKVFILNDDNTLYINPQQVIAQCNFLNKEYYILDINVPVNISVHKMLGGLFLYPVGLLLSNEEAKDYYFKQKVLSDSSLFSDIFNNSNKKNFNIN